MPKLPVILLVFLVFFPLTGRMQLTSDEAGASDTIRLEPDRDTALILLKIRQASAMRLDHSDSIPLLLHEALSESREIMFHDGCALALNHLSYYHLKYQRNTDSALNYASEALDWCRLGLFDEQIWLYTYNSIGLAYHESGRHYEAAFYFYRALAELQLKKLHAPAMTMQLYNNLAGVWQSLTESDKALSYFLRAEKNAVQIQDSCMLALIYRNIGRSYYDKLRPGQAINYASKSLQLSRRCRNIQTEVSALSLIGRAFIDLGNPAKGIRYLRQAVHISAGFPNGSLKYWAAYHLGYGYFRIQQFPSARRYLELAVQLIGDAETNDHRMEVNAYEMLSSIAASEGDYRNAYSYQDSHTKIYKALLNSGDLNALRTLEIRYRTAEKDRELAEKQLELSEKDHKIREQRIWITGISIGLLLVSGLIIVFLRSIRQRQINIRLNSMIRGEEQERTRIARELHDGIGGMLAAIKMNVSAIQNRYKSSPQLSELDGVIKLVEETAAEVRETAHNLMPDVLRKNGLTEALKIYGQQAGTGATAIEMQLYGIPENLYPGFELAIYRIVQELTQNILKHAEATRAIIQLRYQDQRIVIMAEDNGRGFEPGWKYEGVGMRNLRERVNTLNGHISIESAPGTGTTINIEIDAKILKLAGRETHQNLHSR